MKKVIVIVGPTGSGKTGLAVHLGQVFHGEVINGDSVQVYRGLNIGSAKIKQTEMKGVTHHLLDVVEPGEDYSVYHFQQDARRLINQMDVPIIAGGTGLYIKAALYDYVFDDPKRSQAFEDQYKDYTKEELASKLHELDPDMDLTELNRRRLLRALSMASAGSLRSNKKGKDTPLYDPLILYLDIDRKQLEEKLYLRLNRMFDQGLLEEVKDLYQKGIEINAIGYRELFDYLNGKISLDEAKEQIIIHSRRLAKKQKAWFINQMKTIVLDATDEHLFEQATAIVKDFLEGA